MKTLYLHIGTPKTATTAIQSFCWNNRELLAGKGYCYPMFDFTFQNVQKYRNGHFLVARLYTEDRQREYDKEEQIVAEGMEKLLQCFQEYDNVILSDEGIWNRGLVDNTNCWKRLQDHLMDHGITVKVIVYLRRQDDFLFSWWNQQVKEGMFPSSVMDWDAVSEKLPYIQLDYYNILEQIAGYVGKENITVRLFDRGAFKGGSIQKDFLEALRLEDTEEYEVTDSIKNPSLTKNNIEIKRLLNMLPGLDKKRNDYFRRTLTKLSAENSKEERKGMFSETEQHKFLETYKEGNTRLAEEYLGGRELFDYDYHSQGKWQFDNEEALRDIVRFFGTITLKLMKDNEKLKEQLEIQGRHISNIRYKMKHPAKTIVNKLKKNDAG